MKVDPVTQRECLHYPEEDGWVIDYPTSEDIYRRTKEQGVVFDKNKETKSK